MFPVLIVSLILSPITQAARAQEPPARPFPFMQEMEQELRELRTQINDPTQNKSSLDLVKRMEQNSMGARNAVPPMIAKLPSAQQTPKIAAYKALMSKLIAQEQDLEKALRGGQNTKAVEILQAIVRTRQEGHDKFRPSRLGQPGNRGR